MTVDYILDSSMAIEWIIPSADPDEADASAAAFERLSEGRALVPHLWRFEVMNVITRMYRRGDITKAELPRLLTDAFSLVDGFTDEGWPKDVVELAAAHHLSGYDAAYLSAAMFAELPLATLDASLRRAAVEAGVALA